MKFGKIYQEDLQKHWDGEATSFTPWLADNLRELGEAIDMDLEFEAREKRVGTFSVDIVAIDLSTNNKVAIENQFGVTDHKHLGQLITYASVLGADVVVWIAEVIRPEHKTAIDFLNQNLSERLKIYAVEAKVLRIDDSKPAFVLSVVCSPAEDLVEAVSDVSDASEIKLKYKTFFQGLIDDLREKHRFTNARSGQPQNWYTFSSENSRVFRYSASFAQGGRIRVEVYLDCRDKGKNEQLFDCLHDKKAVIEREFGSPLEWERLDSKQACRIAIYRDGAIDSDSESLTEIQEWIIKQLLQFKAVFPEHIRKCNVV